MPPLDLQHVTFYSVQRIGLKIYTGLSAASRVRINNYAEETPLDDLIGYPVAAVHPFRAGTITTDTFQIGDLPAPTRAVQLDHAAGELLDQDVTLTRLQDGLAWHTAGEMRMAGSTTHPPTLTVQAGAVVAVNGNGFVRIGDGGGSTEANLVVAGTAAAPARFTSDAFTRGESPRPGDWSGLFFYPGNFDAAVSRIDHAIFEYGGGQGADGVFNCNDGDGSTWSGEVEFTMSTGGDDYDGPAITSTTFTQSAGNGVRFRCGEHHNGACLKTDYTAPAHGNTFTGFTAHPGQNPMTCPE
jgi:hypothetical protein